MFRRILLAALFATSAAAEPFSFVALGDTTYAPPADNPLYGELIDAINAAQPAFSIHVGDTKGYGDCGRRFQESQRDFFNRFAGPVFYTPGNNEWADCWKANRNAADPTEILALMREVFWSKPESLGRVRLPLVRQSDEIPEFAEFTENARWTFGGQYLHAACGRRRTSVADVHGPRAQPLQRHPRARAQAARSPRTCSRKPCPTAIRCSSARAAR